MRFAFGSTEQNIGVVLAFHLRTQIKVERKDCVDWFQRLAKNCPDLNIVCSCGPRNNRISIVSNQSERTRYYVEVQSDRILTEIINAPDEQTILGWFELILETFSAFLSIGYSEIGQTSIRTIFYFDCGDNPHYVITNALLADSPLMVLQQKAGGKLLESNLSLSFAIEHDYDLTAYLRIKPPIVARLVTEDDGDHSFEIDFMVARKFHNDIRDSLKFESVTNLFGVLKDLITSFLIPQVLEPIQQRIACQ